MLWGDVIGYVFFAIESDRAKQQYEMGLFRNGGHTQQKRPFNVGEKNINVMVLLKETDDTPLDFGVPSFWTKPHVTRKQRTNLRCPQGKFEQVVQHISPIL